ncbi:hypothetical protein CRG98_037048, partial [Punica granatum]
IFVPNPFAVIRSQLSNLLGIPTQDIHQELHQGWDHGIRIAWLSDWTLLRALTPSTASYQRDGCHGFLLLIFGTLLFPYSPNLIDGAIAQVVLQAVGGCAHPNLISSGHACAMPMQRGLGVSTFPWTRERTRVRRSRHLLFTTRRPRAVESPGSRGTRQRGLKEPGVESNRTDGLLENRLAPTATVGPIELPGDI